MSVDDDCVEAEPLEEAVWLDDGLLEEPIAVADELLTAADELRLERLPELDAAEEAVAGDDDDDAPAEMEEAAEEEERVEELEEAPRGATPWPCLHSRAASQSPWERHAGMHWVSHTCPD